MLNEKVSIGSFLAQVTTSATPPSTSAAPPSTTAAPTTTPSPEPLLNASSGTILWVVGGLILVLLAAAFLPTMWDVRKAAEWRTNVTDWVKSGSLRGSDLVAALHVVARPQGTTNLTRTTIAYLALTLAGLALALTAFSGASDATDLRKTIITSLLTVLGIVIGFYFGARTAQTATEQTRALGAAPAVVDAEPTISQLTSGTGRSADPITITGTGLRSARIMFGALPAETDPATSTDTQITVKVPDWPPGYPDTVNIVAVSLSGTSKPSRFTHISDDDPAIKAPKFLR